MHINFYGQDLTPLTQVCDLLEFSCESHLNNSGKCTFALSYNDPHLTSGLLILGKHIQVVHTVAETDHIIFEGIVTSITQNNTKIIFQAVDYLGYLQYRLIEDNWDYSSGVSINTVISRIFGHTDLISPLPFSLGKNDLTESINLTVKKGTVILDLLQQITKIKGECRICNRKLDFSNQTGKTHSTLLNYDYLDGKMSNIISWEWERNVSEVANHILEKDSSGTYYTNSDPASIAEIGFFSKYIYTSSGATQTPQTNTAPLPEIVLDATRLSWWDYQVGDRQNVQIFTPLDYLNLEYLGIVQSIFIELKNQSPQIKISIAEKVKQNANILEQINQRVSNLETN